jgi:hypothetical protein
MSQTNTSLQLEIEKLLRDRIQTHQNSVELRMQGLDFKAEVDRRCGSILGCVQSRMGFVPSSIEKQVELLKALKVRSVLCVAVNICLSHKYFLFRLLEIPHTIRLVTLKPCASRRTGEAAPLALDLRGAREGQGAVQPLA